MCHIQTVTTSHRTGRCILRGGSSVLYEVSVLRINYKYHQYLFFIIISLFTSLATEVAELYNKNIMVDNKFIIVY